MAASRASTAAAAPAAPACRSQQGLTRKLYPAASGCFDAMPFFQSLPVRPSRCCCSQHYRPCRLRVCLPPSLRSLPASPAHPDPAMPLPGRAGPRRDAAGAHRRQRVPPARDDGDPVEEVSVSSRWGRAEDVTCVPPGAAKYTPSTRGCCPSERQRRSRCALANKPLPMVAPRVCRCFSGQWGECVALAYEGFLVVPANGTYE